MVQANKFRRSQHNPIRHDLKPPKNKKNRCSKQNSYYCQPASQPADDSKNSNGVNSLLPNQNSNPLQKSRKGKKKKRKKKERAKQPKNSTKNKREGDDAKTKDEQRRNPESPKCWPPAASIREWKEQQLVAHTAREFFSKLKK